MNITLNTAYTVDPGPTGTAIEMLSIGNTQTSTQLVQDDKSEKSRIVIDLSASPARPNAAAPGGYSQSRRNLTLKVPKVLDNENTTVNSIKATVSFDPETTSAEVKNLVDKFVALIYDATYNKNFTIEGSVAS